MIEQPVNGTFDDVTDSVLEALMYDENDDCDNKSGAKEDFCFHAIPTVIITIIIIIKYYNYIL